MATQKDLVVNKSALAVADYSAKQFHAVVLGASGWTLCSTRGQSGLIGLLQNKPELGQVADVCLLGLSKAKLGGTVGFGDPLCTTTTGALIKATDNDEHVVGVAGEAGVSGDVIQIAVGMGGSLASGIKSQEVYKAAANYSSTGQYLAVKAHTTAGEAVKCNVAGEAILGILQNAPAAGADCVICTYGECTAKAGGTIAAGDQLAIDSSAQVVAASGNAQVIGWAVAAIASGATGTIFVAPRGLYSVDGSGLANTKMWVGNGSNVAVAVNMSGDATLANDGAVTVGAKKIAASKLYSAAQGTILKADASNVFSELSLADGKIAVGNATDVTAVSAKTSGQILVGDGTTLASVAVSGDATLASDGALTVGNKKIAAAKLYSAAQGAVFRTDATNAVSELSLADGKIAVGDGTDVTALTAKTAGQVLVGNGTTLASVAVSGDARLASSGALTLTKDKIRTKTVEILAAAVKTLDLTPVVLLDFSVMQTAGEVAAGDALVFHGAVVQLYGGAASYDRNENMTIQYGAAGAGATLSTTLANFCDGGAAGKMSTIKPIVTDVAPDADEDIDIKCSASPFNAQGDRNLQVTVYYSVYTPHA